MSFLLWLVTYVLHSTLIYTGVLLLRGWVKEARMAQAMWRTAALLPLASATVSHAFGIAFWTIHLRGHLTPSPGPVTSAFLVESNGTKGMALPVAALITYFAIALVLLFRDFLARWLFISRLRRRTVDDDRISGLLAEIVTKARLNRQVHLTYTDLLTPPMALGRTEICLPTPLLGALRTHELEALLAHEFAHLLRRDPLWFCIMGWTECLLFIQPLNRIARRELQYLAETACDRWAANQVSDAETMARCIVEVADWMKMSSLLVPAAVNRRDLLRRVSESLEQDHSGERIRVRPPVFFVALLMAIGLFPSLTAKPNDKPDHASLPPFVTEEQHRSTELQKDAGQYRNPRKHSARTKPGAAINDQRVLDTATLTSADSAPTTRTEDDPSEAFIAGFDAAQRFRNSEGNNPMQLIERSLSPQSSPARNSSNGSLSPQSRMEIERRLLKGRE